MFSRPGRSRVTQKFHEYPPLAAMGGYLLVVITDNFISKRRRRAGKVARCLQLCRGDRRKASRQNEINVADSTRRNLSSLSLILVDSLCPIERHWSAPGSNVARDDIT